jgi:hypothetical protein
MTIPSSIVIAAVASRRRRKKTFFFFVLFFEGLRWVWAKVRWCWAVAGLGWSCAAPRASDGGLLRPGEAFLFFSFFLFLFSILNSVLIQICFAGF